MAKSRFERLKSAALILGGSIALTAVLFQFEFNPFEAWTYDMRLTWGPQPAPDSRIVLISLDDRTLKALNDFAPLPLDAHTRLLEALESYRPAAIGYLVNLSHVAQANPSLVESDWSKRFVQAARRLESRGIPMIVGTPFDVNGEVLPPYPLSTLNHSVAVVHTDGNVFARDRKTRRALTYLYGKPAFHLNLAQQMGALELGFTPRGSFYVPTAEASYAFFKYRNSSSEGNSYPNYSMIDLLEDRVPRENLQGKILLIGTTVHENPGDFTLSPVGTPAGGRISKLEANGHILDSILNNDTLVLAPTWVDMLVTAILVSIVLWASFTLSPAKALTAMLAIAGSYHLLAMAIFSGFGTEKGVWIKESQPLAGVLAAYYLMLPARLILEFRKRWEYQKKNALLTQVEELKTNFLSLVTHDLKTPVARIQGLAEVLIKKTSAKLSSNELESVQHILDSTEELNHFITSILELNKIDSNRLHIRFEQKDFNQLVERSIETFRAPAQAKRIRFVSHLEPLFPIKIDPQLISKVLNNLLDNAIKYSRPDTEIRVETSEDQDWVTLVIKDSGIGMTEEEMKNLFTRFYRAKNDTTTSVTGTGLGLYLTRYFIEAHQGTVSVASEKNHGTTFTIRLPVQLNSISTLSTKEHAHV